MKKLLLLGIMLLGMGGANYAHELDKCVHELDKKITFEEALISTDPFVIVQDGKVLCGPLSSTDGSLTFKDVTEISDYAYSFKFEDAGEGNYYMNLYNQEATPASKGYVIAAIWSHTYLSGNKDQEGIEGCGQWTIAEAGEKLYTIRNVGVKNGGYNNKPNGNEGDRTALGFLAITTDGYWANHVTHYNTSGTWEFWTLKEVASVMFFQKNTFDAALASTDPYVIVQDEKVLCGPLSSTDGSLTFKNINEIYDYAYSFKFEDAGEGNYYMNLYNQEATPASKGYVIAAVWSHTFLSGNKGQEGIEGCGQWTIAEAGEKLYTIRNVGVKNGGYNNKPNGNDGDRTALGYLAITTGGYWANHVTHYNTSGTWEFWTQKNNRTYSCDKALDFSDVDGLEAYAITAFNPSTATLTLTKVTKAPANTGLYLVNTNEKFSYKIPVIASADAIEGNLLHASSGTDNLEPTDGSNTNLIFGGTGADRGFHTLSAAGIMGANKAYLQIPTDDYNTAMSASAPLRFVFEDEDATGIVEVKTVENTDDAWYTLNGVKLNGQPTEKGIYINNGKKVIIK